MGDRVSIPLWLSKAGASAPGIPTDLRMKLATRAAHDLSGLGREHEAIEVLQEAARKTAGLGGIELAALASERSLKAGEIPSTIDAQVQVLLDLADTTSTATDRTRILGRAAALAFHRLRHLDSPDSPLAEDPAAFLNPFRSSTAWQGLTAPRHPSRQSKDARAATSVVVVVDDDVRFLEPMIAAIQDVEPAMEFRVIRLQKWAMEHSYKLPLNPYEQINTRANPHVGDEPWAVALQQELADANIVWVEWCQRAAVLVSLLDLADRRLVIRLHSFEAFTVFPQLVDPSAVDALVTVSPTFERLVKAVTPDLGERTTYVPNAIDLRGISQDKDPGASHTLGLVGWAAPAKDATWAFDVLELLRRHDDQWTLHLVGAAPDPNGSAGEAAYASRVNEQLINLGPAVTQAGQVTDVDAELRKVGVILSSSTRESFHVALAEGIASGARPVVRDWPTLARFGGAATTWPAEWIVQTPEEAVELITGPAPISAQDHIPDRHQAAARMLAVLRGTNVQ